MRSPAVKRLMREAKELCDPTEEFYAQPLEDNLFEWHFTVGGAPDTDFESGLYHGRIILPAEYPMKPPSIILLTPNGRFEVNKKICLSISGHHPESWQPSWSIRTALLAIIGFMPTPGNGAIGSLDYKPDERKLLAKKSHDWNCPICGSIKDTLAKHTQHSNANEEAMQLAAQISFKGENEQSTPPESNTSSRVPPSEAPIMSPGVGGMPFSPLLSNPVSIALPSAAAAAIPVNVPPIPMRVGLQPDSGDAAVPIPSNSASKSDIKADSADSSHSCASVEKNESLRRRSNITATQLPSTSSAMHTSTNVKPPTAVNINPRFSSSTVIIIVLISFAILGLLFRRLFLL